MHLRRPLTPGVAPRSAPVPTRATLLVVLLLLTVALAALLGYEAHQAARSQRVTAERALRDYAAFAAREFLSGATASLDTAVTGALRPFTAVRATSPYEPLAAPDRLLPAAGSSGAACPEPDDAPAVAFALDLGTGQMRVAEGRGGGGGGGGGGARGKGEGGAAWVRDTVRAHARAAYRPAWAYGAILGAGEARGRAVVYGVRYAEHGVPVAAYGWTVCTAALVTPLVRAAASRSLLVPSVGAVMAGDSLLALSVHDATGAALHRSVPDDSSRRAAADRAAGAHAAEVVLERLGGVRVRASLRPAAARWLAVEWPPRSRLPLLLGLLALAAGLTVIAGMQIRREHELVRLRADFTSSVSHELRTPLAQILLYAETLSLGRVRTRAERREAAETIVQEARRLIHMVENVLHFARAERGGNRLDPRPTALAPALRGILTTFAPLAEAQGVRLRAELDEELVAMTDEGALRQVALNLLDNAVKYGPPGQTVTVGAARVEGRARMWVEDEGPGIPPPDRERIWHPFVRMTRDRGSSSSGPARGGSGIGLSVVRELAALHGGRAWVEGRADGSGARFVVELGEARGGGGGERGGEGARAAALPPGHTIASAGGESGIDRVPAASNRGGEVPPLEGIAPRAEGSGILPVPHASFGRGGDGPPAGEMASPEPPIVIEGVRSPSFRRMEPPRWGR
jgi:signal transduction histidine kinase